MMYHLADDNTDYYINTSLIACVKFKCPELEKEPIKTVPITVIFSGGAEVTVTLPKNSFDNFSQDFLEKTT